MLETRRPLNVIHGSARFAKFNRARDNSIELLRYLIEDYWGRRAGWPDLLIFSENEFFFAEVKSATDRLGKSQQRRLRDNRERLHFPFKLVEVRKMGVKRIVSSASDEMIDAKFIRQDR